jgi:hypothetical protein
MVAGWLYSSRISIKSVWRVYATASLLLVLLLVAWKRLGMVNFFGPHGWGAPLTILFVSVVLLAKEGAIKVPRWSVWMGNISYSLYLVHVCVFEILQRITTTISLNHAAFEVVLFVMRPIAAVICAWATFHYIEAPISTWARKRLLNLRVLWRLQAKSTAPDSGGH